MPLNETVRLDIQQAEARIAALTADIGRLSSTQTVDVEVDIDDTPFRTIDERLESIERNVSDVNREVADIAVSARSSSVEFEQMAQALGVSEAEARQLADEILSADRAARQIDDAAREVARQLGLADDDARRFANELGRASREARDTDAAMSRVANTANRVRIAIVGAVAAFGVTGLIRGADAAIESFNLLNESVNAVNVTFGEGADTVFEFGENVARTAGLARGEFQQAVVPIGAVLRNFGFDARQAGAGAVELTQRAADLASVFNVEVPEALNAIGSALRGESEPLRRFGGDISAARVEAFALSSGLAATTADIDDLVRVQARYNLILQDTARVQGDFARTADDPANAARILAAEAENARAALGESLIPAYQEILRVTPQVIAAFEDVGPAVGQVASAIAGSADEIAGSLTATLNFLAGVPAAIEVFAIQVETLPTQLLGIAAAIPILDEVVGLIADTGELADASADRAARLAEAYAKLDLITSIQAGIPPLAALVGALDNVVDAGGDVADELEDLARIAGFSGTELIPILRNIIAEADRFGLSAADVEAFRLQIGQLLDELAFPPGSFEGLIPDLSGFEAEVGPAIVTLADLQTAAREAGVTIQEALGSDLFPAGTVFDVFAQAEVQVANFRDRVNEIGREIDPLKGATEQLDISRADFIANLQAAFAQEVGFEANLARLANRGFDALADRLRELGPGAATLAEEFLENVADATVANDVFDASANRVATGLSDALREEFTGSLFTGLPADLARTLAAAFETDPGTGFDSLAEKQARQINQGLRAPAARSQLETAGKDSAEDVAAGFAAEVERLAPEVGFDAAIDIARALTSGDAASAATQAGIDWARLFSAAVAANVSFDFDRPPGGGTPVPSTVPQSPGSAGLAAPTGGTSITITNPIVTDLPTALAQAEQAAQTVGVLLQ